MNQTCCNCLFFIFNIVVHNLYTYESEHNNWNLKPYMGLIDVFVIIEKYILFIKILP